MLEFFRVQDRDEQIDHAREKCDRNNDIHRGFLSGLIVDNGGNALIPFSYFDMPGMLLHARFTAI